jgi:diguanylate cyclase (GGDEF)-like protein
MIQGKDKIHDLIRQAASLHVVNTIYFVGLIVMWLFTANVSHSLDIYAVDTWMLRAATLLGIIFIFKMSMHYFISLQKRLSDEEFELTLSMLNVAATFFILHAIKRMPEMESTLNLLYAFLPVMLFILVSPLTWNKRSAPYYGFFGFMEWLLILSVLSWGGSVLFALYNAGSYHYLGSNVVIFCSPLLVKTMRKRHIDKFFEKIHTEIYTDPLTGIQNRKCFYDFYDRLREENKKNIMQGDGLGVIFIDIDHFKKFNDRYGHDEGDKCLKTVADEIKNIADRFGLQAFRYGGEEFLICGDISKESWINMQSCAPIKDWIDSDYKLNIKHECMLSGKLTMSAGACFFESEIIYKNNAAGVTKVADYFLYKAKDEGRSKIIFGNPDEFINSGLKE